MIDENWVESEYDWINALIELNQNGIPELLSISVFPDIRNNSRSLIEVNINYIIFDIIFYPFFQKINDPDVDLKENIEGIFTHPQNWKKYSYNSNDDDPEKLNPEKLRKIAEILKGSPIDDEQWTVKKKAIGELDKLLNKTESNVSLSSPTITVENLIDDFQGIDWMRLLNRIFRNTNIDIKPNDLVRVPFPQYLLQILNVISNQPKE